MVSKEELVLLGSDKNITFRWYQGCCKKGSLSYGLCDKVKIVCIIIPEAVGAFVSWDWKARTRQFSRHCPLVLSPTHLYGHRIMSPPTPRTILDHIWFQAQEVEIETSKKDGLYLGTRSLGALQAPSSSWRPFGPLDFVLRELRALRPCDLRHSDWIVC